MCVPMIYSIFLELLRLKCCYGNSWLSFLDLLLSPILVFCPLNKHGIDSLVQKWTPETGGQRPKRGCDVWKASGCQETSHQRGEPGPHEQTLPAKIVRPFDPYYVLRSLLSTEHSSSGRQTCDAPSPTI